jgi:hypothetical protein
MEKARICAAPDLLVTKNTVPPGSVRGARRRVAILWELPLRQGPYVLGVFLGREVHVGQYETQYG